MVHLNSGGVLVQKNSCNSHAAEVLGGARPGSMSTLSKGLLCCDGVSPPNPFLRS